MGQASSLQNSSEKKELSLAARFASGIIRFYQIALSPLLGPTCRFYPTCSHYALEAIREHGFFKGSWLAICRIGKCHPLHPGGVDFVPPADSVKKEDAHDAA